MNQSRGKVMLGLALKRNAGANKCDYRVAGNFNVIIEDVVVEDQCVEIETEAEAAIEAAIETEAETAIETMIDSEAETVIEEAIETTIETEVETAIKKTIDSEVVTAIKKTIDSEAEMVIEKTIDSEAETAIEKTIDSEAETAIEKMIDSEAKTVIEAAIETTIETAVIEDDFVEIETEYQHEKNNNLETEDKNWTNLDAKDQCVATENLKESNEPSTSNWSSKFAPSENEWKLRSDDSDEENLEEDLDDSDLDPNFKPKARELAAEDSEDSEISEVECKKTNKRKRQNNNNNKESSTDSDITPKRSRIRTVNPQSWKRNKAKQLRNSGKEYQNRFDKTVPARVMGPPCAANCRLKCSTKFSEERSVIFNNYWSMESYIRQRDFIKLCMQEIKPKYVYKKPNSKRKGNHSFNFEKNETKTRVCKTFFKATLAINDRPIRTVIDRTENGFTLKDQRGCHGKQYTVDEETKIGIRNHIDSIPRVDSHYLRAQTTREFMEGGKSMADLHRDYEKKCKEEGRESAKFSLYMHIFNTEYNIGIFSPKKDQCEFCESFKNADEKSKEIMKEKYEKHHNEKKLARNEKKQDKEKAEVNKSLIIAVYDLQAVLPLPKGDVSIFFYKSKLNVLNFTICQLNSEIVECFTWHEGEAKRGANEIATCVFKYLQKITTAMDDENLELIFYSDNCCGQQKNQFMFSIYMHAVKRLKIKSITHKFLITGHTQNEGDNCHKLIQDGINRHLKSGAIYVPAQFVSIIQGAKKKGKPYIVNAMTHEDFYDVKKLAIAMGVNFSKTTEKKPVNFIDIKIIKIEKSCSNTFFFKTSYTDEDYQQIEINPRKTRKSNPNEAELTPLYSKKLEIGDHKKKDLQQLITNPHIPAFYADFYKNII